MEPNTPQHQLAKQITAGNSSPGISSPWSQITDNPFFTAV
jgi:chaperone BCS1